ncbi:universal stress protein [Streptomyces sp. NPDC001922]|uniref:universal stress protein n=1 Tax=Streptomyces sp. NPDC001922 TaxID=3364624 RepID=UPI0036914482
MDIPLVVGVDGSDSSLEAVDWAVDEAERHGLQLRLVHGSLWERYEGTRPSLATDRPAERILAEHIAASAAERAQRRNPDVKVSSDVLAADPTTALLREGHEAFALVTGSRGRGMLGETLLGSVSLTVAARAVCPVIIVRGEDPARRDGLPVVLGVGERSVTSAAVRFAVAEAEVRNCPLHVVRAWRTPAHEAVEHLLPTGDAPAPTPEQRATDQMDAALRGVGPVRDGAVVRRITAEGPAHKVLADASAEASLLVIGAPRSHGHVGLQLGRVAHALLHHAACPVAVVPQRG